MFINRNDLESVSITKPLETQNFKETKSLPKIYSSEKNGYRYTIKNIWQEFFRRNFSDGLISFQKNEELSWKKTNHYLKENDFQIWEEI